MKNWNKIQTGCGNAAHIPAAIKRLGSADETERYKAYWKIDNHAIVQSDLYEAAFYIIEPLIELLEKPYTVDRISPLRVLTEIAGGGAESNEIVLQDNGMYIKERLDIACKKKLSELKERIKKIELKTQLEKNEFDFLIESI